MQNNPNESYYDENGTLTLAVTHVWDIEPEPTPKRSIENSVKHPVPGIRETSSG